MVVSTWFILIGMIILILGFLITFFVGISNFIFKILPIGVALVLIGAILNLLNIGL